MWVLAVVAEVLELAAGDEQVAAGELESALRDDLAVGALVLELVVSDDLAAGSAAPGSAVPDYWAAEVSTGWERMVAAVAMVV
jgi:hypothetical protein